MAIDARNLDDPALVRAVQQGDPEAFAPLFDRHYDRVRRACFRRMGGSSEADEVAQAAFVRAFERIHQCTGERRFGAWVQVIADHLCADTWRARARTTPVEHPVGAEVSAGPDECEEAVLRTEQAAAVHQALAALPSRQREVIIARDVEGRRPTEIAAALAVSVGTVDSLLLRARRRMALAYRAASPEQGAASATVSTASVAAGSAAAGPVARVAESVTGALHSGIASLASVLGLGPAAPGVAQRVVGGVVAGALVVGPLAVAHDTARPPVEAGPPAFTFPAAPYPAELDRPLSLPAPAAPAAPDPVAAADPLAGAEALAAPAPPDPVMERAPDPTVVAAPDPPLPRVAAEVELAVDTGAGVAAEIAGAVGDLASTQLRLLRASRLR